MNLMLARLTLLSTIWVAPGPFLLAQSESGDQAPNAEATVAETTLTESAIAEGESLPDGTIASDQPAMNPFMEFLANPLNLILISAILFMFIVVRPQQRQAKQLQSQLASLKKNDRVVTASGIHGTIVQANSGEETISIRIDESTGARLTINRESVAKIASSDTKKS